LDLEKGEREQEGLAVLGGGSRKKLIVDAICSLEL